MNFLFQNGRYPAPHFFHQKESKLKTVKLSLQRSGSIEYKDGHLGGLGWAGASWEFSSLRVVHVMKVSPRSVP